MRRPRQAWSFTRPSTTRAQAAQPQVQPARRTGAEASRQPARFDRHGSRGGPGDEAGRPRRPGSGAMPRYRITRPWADSGRPGSEARGHHDTRFTEALILACVLVRPARRAARPVARPRVLFPADLPGRAQAQSRLVRDRDGDGATCWRPGTRGAASGSRTTS